MNNRHKTGKRRLTARFFVLMISAVVAVSLGLTCALWFGNDPARVMVGDGAGSGGVTTSATSYSNLTGDKSATGSLVKGDTITYSAGSSFSIKLPKGTFKFEVYGAQGGYYDTGCYGGKGGYTYGNYEVTATAGEYVYIYVGSQGGSGSSANKAGGFNGGGTGGRPNGGGGGGGATHIALVNNYLYNLSSTANQAKVLVVAGGGGGSTTSAHSGSYGQGGYGGGGNNNGGSSSGGYAYSQATGGTQTSGGTRGRGYSGSSCSPTYGTNGSFGQGGSSRTSSYEDGGGGGGGWYGGGGGGGDNDSSGADGRTAGGGGSGHINTSLMSSYGGSSGVRSGNGTAIITVVSVNQEPTSKNASVGSFYRGSANKAVTASSLATDPEGTAVYFTTGASNLDTYPTGSNNYIYTDQGCSTVASAYINWTWNSNQQFTITNVLRYPSGGTLTLYTRMRDNFGTSTTRGWSIIRFYITVLDNALTVKSPAGVQEITPSGASYSYRFGTPTHTGAANANGNYMQSGYIYNPTSSTAKTVFLPKAIAPTDTTAYTIYASDIYSDADTAHDRVGFVSYSVDSGYSGYSGYYTVTYNKDTTNYASSIVPSITIKASGVRPSGSVYVVLTLSAQSSENVSKTAIGSVNNSVKLVFKIANTRPYFASTNDLPASVSLNEPSVKLQPGGTATVSLSSMIYDIDDSSLASYFAQTPDGSIPDLKVPTREYVQVDMSGVKVPLKSSVNSKASNYYAYTTDSNIVTNSDVGANYTANDVSALSGEGKTPTGFDPDMICASNASADKLAKACVTYSYDNNKTIRFTAKAATRSMYSDATREGDFYVLVRVVDPADTADKGIWYPIAIEVESAAPTEPSSASIVSLGFAGYTAGTEASDAIPGSGTSQYLTPISYYDEANEQLKGIGTHNSTFMRDDGDHAMPFVRDGDGFMFPDSGDTVTHALNDFTTIVTDPSTQTLRSDALTLYDTGSFFTVEPTRMYAAQTVFNKATDAQLRKMGVSSFTGQGSANGYCFWGLKITALRSTGNMYYRFDVKVTDMHDKVSVVGVYVKISNRGVSVRRGIVQNSGESTSYPVNTVNGKGVYGYNSNISSSAVNYTMQRGDVLEITPYDFAYDLDNDPDNTLNGADGFNTNPDNSDFATAVAHIRQVYSIPNTASPTSGATLAATDVYAQQLSFANPSAIITNAAQYSSYISVAVNQTTSKNGTQPIPCIQITALSRTTAAVVQIKFNITDGDSQVACMFTVTVKNAKPVLNTSANNPTGFQIEEPYTMVAEVAPGKINSYSFTAADIAYDRDDDTPVFTSGSASVKALYENNYYRYLNFDPVTGLYSGTTTPDGSSIDLYNYAYAVLTKNSSGIDIVQVTALSSTELFNLPIYLEVNVQDGYRAQPENSDLHVLIHVRNSEIKTNTESLLDGVGGSKQWQISYEDESEMKLARYIVNSKDLCESSAIGVASAYKIWLFDDADEQQRAMLDPIEWKTDGGNFDKNSNIIKTVDASTVITAETFANNPNSAILYGPTYRSNSGDNMYLDISVEFFVKDGDTFTALDSTDARILNAKYWAIKIQDKQVGTSTASATQISIAVRDDHYGKYYRRDGNRYIADNIYTYNAEKTSHVTTGGSSVKFINFYYNYLKPGITAMHSYYRTDPYLESMSKVSDDANAPYMLYYAGLHNYQFDGNAPTSQAELQTATQQNKFKPDLKYQYFVKNYASVDGNDESVPTYKHFETVANDAFYYKPIEVGGGSSNSDVIVPISYIAMPQGISSSTEGSSGTTTVKNDNDHVTFANATSTRATNDTTPLSDYDFMSWGNTQASLNYVLDNFTLTDPNGITYVGRDINTNPYLTFGYVAVGYDSDNCPSTAKALNSRLVNSKKFTLLLNGSLESKQNMPDDTVYREDRFGFTVKKKVNGYRTTGTLKLSVALKTTRAYVDLGTGAEVCDDGKTEKIEVDIVIVNDAPTVSYKTNTLGTGATGVGMVSDIKLNMTTRDTTGKKVALYKTGNVPTDSQEVADEYLTYSNVKNNQNIDTTDTMKFYMPSANSPMEESDVRYLVSGLKIGDGADVQLKYFNDPADTMSISDKLIYEANPGYERFFTVSPSSGASSSIEFTPVAKTDINTEEKASENGGTYTDDDVYEDFHLLPNMVTTATGEEQQGYYYPFRILFYDDIDESPFSSGFVGVAIIRVRIQNDPITVNDAVVDADTYRTSNTAYSQYNGTKKYTLRLSKGTPFYIDVSNVLMDNDIVLNGASLAIKTDSAWTNLNTEQKTVHDYLIMPAATGTVLGTNYGVTVEAPEAGSPLPKTTLIFKAAYAFKTTTDILYTFRDSGGSSVNVVFSVAYNNEAPSANPATFGTSDSIAVTLKSGDSITFHVADGTLIENDRSGGFASAALTNPLVPATYPKTSSAAELKAAYDATTPGSGDLGALVLATDDAPSTLRIKAYSFSAQNYLDYIEIVGSNQAKCESDTNRYYMTYTVRAKGVINTTLTFEVVDSAGAAASTFIKVALNVTASAPTAKDGADLGLDAAGLTPDAAEPNTFNLVMSYGEEKEYTLASFMTDEDYLDENTFNVVPITGTTYYSITNPEGVSAVSVTKGEVNGSETIKIKANDFIPNYSDKAVIRFKVADAHNASSEPICFNVSILPRDVTEKATITSFINRSYELQLNSYQQYMDSAEQATTVQLVEVTGDAAVMFADDDVTAPSAKYDVLVYALLEKQVDNTYAALKPAQFDAMEEVAKQQLLLCSIVDSTLTDRFSSDIYFYVTQFFSITVSTDGKTLEFTPLSATIAGGNSTALNKITLYVELRKHYTSSTGTKMSAKKGYMNVSVGNSALQNVEENIYNEGFPRVPVSSDPADGTRLRDEGFLHFTGTAGDSLTWPLYDTENVFTGLFYDYDMINNETAGLETINYVKYSISGISEPVTGKGDVLSVSSTDNGRSVTIKINRKVYPGQPGKEGNDTSYTDAVVTIYAADTIGYRTYRTNNSQESALVTTQIRVRIENDIPEIKAGSRVTENGVIGYTINYTDRDGYVLEASIAKGEKLELLISEIIDDADIAMDQYAMLYTGDEDSLLNSDGVLINSTSGEYGIIKSNGADMFEVRTLEVPNDYGISGLTKITFTGVSSARGTVATAKVMFRDSVKNSNTRVLNIMLTVGNLAPYVKPAYSSHTDGIEITVMGVGKNADDAAVDRAKRNFTILDYVADDNGDVYDAMAADSGRRPTYAYIDSFMTFTDGDRQHPPQIYGPATKPAPGESDDDFSAPNSVCDIAHNMTIDDNKNQGFVITPRPGLYGVQYVMLSIIDSGFDDGSSAGVLDGKQCNVLFKITIANPLEDVASDLGSSDVAVGITRTVDAEMLLGEENAHGYSISKIEENGSAKYFDIKQGENGKWLITANVEDVPGNFKVTFTAGEGSNAVTVDRTFHINTVENRAPTYLNGKKSYKYIVSSLTDPSRRVLKVYPEMWFEDPDDEDIMTFVNPVSSSQTVKVETLLDYDENDRPYLLLTFNRRGEADITVNIRDLSNSTYERTITVNCTDAPELSGWENLVSLIEANWLWFWIIVAGAVLLIALIIVLIIIIHKKRKIRREIEMLLNSETELEEEMMRLGMGSSMPYQSFGYLPPTTQTVNNPGFMLGGSANNPTPNGLQLNAGTGMNPMGTTGQVPPTQAPPNNMTTMNGMPQQPMQPPQAPPNNDGFDPSDF